MDDRILVLPREDARSVTDVFCEAFESYPVMRFVLGDEPNDYGGRLRRLVHFFVMARALRDEPLLGVGGSSRLDAAATVSFPGTGESPPELAELRDEVWRELGEDARTRYEACGEVWSTLEVEVPHVHLNMIGVRRSARGQGLARLLLDHVHRIAVETQGARGVTLTTEDPVNVDVYRHVGYEVVGTARIAPTLETWSMFRGNRSEA